MTWTDEHRDDSIEGHPNITAGQLRAAYDAFGPDSDPRSLPERLAAALSAAVSAGPEPEPLPEWQCPSCGATTRARMADAGPEPAEYQEWAARERLDGEVYTFRDERTARRFVAAVDHPDAPVELIRRTLGEWEPVDV